MYVMNSAAIILNLLWFKAKFFTIFAIPTGSGWRFFPLQACQMKPFVLTSGIVTAYHHPCVFHLRLLAVTIQGGELCEATFALLLSMSSASSLRVTSSGKMHWRKKTLILFVMSIWYSLSLSTVVTMTHFGVHTMKSHKSTPNTNMYTWTWM